MVERGYALLTSNCPVVRGAQTLLARTSLKRVKTCKKLYKEHNNIDCQKKGLKAPFQSHPHRAIA